MISIEEAREAIRNDEIVIYPTDTVLGMGCNPFSQKAVDKLFKTLRGKKIPYTLIKQFLPFKLTLLICIDFKNPFQSVLKPSRPYKQFTAPIIFEGLSI